MVFMNEPFDFGDFSRFSCYEVLGNSDFFETFGFKKACH